MPDNFVKIYRSILTSSVWEEDPPTKVVWITMLAYADLNGTVWATIPGLARLAGVTREQAEKALRVLSRPDPDSRTREHDGRRIVPVDGGWTLLNHSKYRALRTPTQVKNAERQKRFYDKNKGRKKAGGDNNGPNGEDRQPNASDTQKEKEIEKNGERTSGADAPAVSPEAPPKPPSWSSEACDAWTDRFGGTAPGGEIGKHLKPLVAKHGPILVLLAFRRYLRESDPKYSSPGGFAKKFGEWSVPVPAPSVVVEKKGAIETFLEASGATFQSLAKQFLDSDPSDENIIESWVAWAKRHDVPEELTYSIMNVAIYHAQKERNAKA